MMRYFKFVLILLILSSCVSNPGERTGKTVVLRGERVAIDSDVSLFEIVYVDDSLLIASVLSPSYKLASYRIGSNGKPYEFLGVGRGPMEVMYANIISCDDTLLVLSYTPSGLQELIKIPVSGIYDMSRWKSTDFSDVTEISIGCNFDVLPSYGYIMPGGKFGSEIVLSVLSEKNSNCTSLPFWPEDGRDIASITRQIMYTRGARVFCNKDKVLYACGEGRYFSILDLSSGNVTETVIYDEYPEYKVAPDGVNPERSPESGLGGISYATDSLIFLCPLDCRIVNGKYVPEDYKGYPPYYSDRIEVYNWDGEYICSYVTDVPFSTFYVKGSDIYTLTINKETFLSEVYRYRCHTPQI